MGKFETTTARQELGFTPTTGVRANIDVRTGGAEVARAITGAGFAVVGELKRRSVRKEELRVRNRKNLDSLSSRQADELRKQMNSSIEAMKIDTLPEKWEEETTKIVTEWNGRIGELDFSPEASAKQQIQSDGDLAVIPEQSFIDASRKISAATIVSEQESLTDAHRNNAENLSQIKIDFISSMQNNGVSAPEILLKLKAAEEAGEKLRKEDTLDSWRDQIAENPAVALDKKNPLSLASELELRKKDKGNIPEEELDSKDIQSLLNTAINRQAQLIADAEKQLNLKNSALETELHNSIVAGDASITDISKSGLPAASQRRLEKDLSDTDKRNIAKTWALQDTPTATEEIRGFLSSIEAGSIDINQARSALSKLARDTTTDGRSIVSKVTFDKTMAQFIKGGRDAIETFTDEQTAKVENALTFRLTEREARLRLRAEVRTLSPRERREFAATGLLLQVARHQLNLYNEGLAQRLRTLKIEDTSGKEAKAEAVSMWEGIKRKPLEQEINDFLDFSGEQLVRPSGIPADTWESANATDKAAIINGISKGFAIEQILEAITK